MTEQENSRTISDRTEQQDDDRTGEQQDDDRTEQNSMAVTALENSRTMTEQNSRTITEQNSRTMTEQNSRTMTEQNSRTMTERGVWAMRCKAGLSEASTEPAIISRLNKRQTLGQSLSEHFSVTVAQSERKPEAEKCDTDVPPSGRWQ